MIMMSTANIGSPRADRPQEGELPDGVDTRGCDAEPLPELAAACGRERGEQLEGSEEEHDPTPRVQVAEHEGGLEDVDLEPPIASRPSDEVPRPPSASMSAAKMIQPAPFSVSYPRTARGVILRRHASSDRRLTNGAGPRASARPAPRRVNCGLPGTHRPHRMMRCRASPARLADGGSCSRGKEDNGMMMRRRRPLARAAMVGGAAYYAGKKVESGHEREAEQEARLADLESQQQAGQYQAPPPQYRRRRRLLRRPLRRRCRPRRCSSSSSLQRSRSRAS